MTALIYRFADCWLDADRRELRRSGDLVEVEPQVFDVLHLLIRQRERVVSRDDLIAGVWRGRIVSESTLTSRITAVRQAIGDSGQAQRLIRTMPRKGFRFVGDVREGGPSLPTDAAPAPPAPTAGRRQLTVLACEIDTGTISTRSDPEDIRELMAACQSAIKATVEQFGGFLAQPLADGALAYFGYPEAHEDDAERATAAALAAVRAIAALRFPHLGGRPALRIGVATGLVVVGDQLTSSGAVEHMIAGETPHLAARLRTEAAAGEVLVSLETRRLIGGFFDYADDEVKSIGVRVVGESSVASRFDALRVARSALVGRQEELDLLTRRWRQVQAGEGRVVLIWGEAGIGKSRLAAAVQEATRAPQALLRYDCSPHRTQTALFPVIHQFERAAGIQASDGAAARRDKLNTLLASSSDDPALDLPLFATLLGVATDADRAALSLSPQRQKELLLERLAARLAGLAARQPMLLIVEDAHWIDQTTREWCDILVERVRSLPILLIMTYRPEFAPAWLGQSHVTALTLNRLGRRDNAAVISQVAGPRALPPALVEQIIERTDGVPLFIEEMTKSVLESDIVHEQDGSLVLAAPLPTLPVPTTLQASLVARLDRLASARAVVQTGSALGREFTYPLLKAVIGLDDDTLRPSLERLVSSDLVHCRGTAPHALYTFKHALVQDAPHGTLLRAERKRLHGRIVEVLEQQFPDVPRQNPDELAYHCTEAALWERAIEYRLRAARIALDRCAGAEAQAQVETAIAVLPDIADGAVRQRLEGNLLALLGDCYVMTKGFGSGDVFAVLSRARDLLDEAIQPILCLRTLCGLFNYHLMRSEAPLAMRLCTPYLQRPVDQLTAPVIQYLTGAAHLHMGNLKPACRHLETAASLHHAEARRPIALIAGYNMPVFTQVWLGLGYLYRGAIDRALQAMATAVDQARKESHPFTLVSAVLAQARFFSHLRDIEAAIAATEEGHAIAVEQRSPYHISRANVLRVVNQIDAGELGSCSLAMEHALAAHRATGANYQSSYNTSYLAMAHAQAGSTALALEFAEQAIGEGERSGERWWNAEAHRIKAQLLLVAARREEAEAGFEAALACARRQGARLWELQAAQSLAQLWSERAARVRGRDLLGAVYAGFPDGFETPVLKDAKRVLDLLS